MRFPALISVVLLCGCAPEVSEEPPQPAAAEFRAEVIDPELGVGYAVLTADIDADGAADVVALSENRVIWYENPDWTPHVVSKEAATPDHVCFAAEDIDGDGDLDLALGADWQPRNTEGAGTLGWLEQGDDPRAEWTLHEVTSEPTLHRIRWADIDGDDDRELLVAPLHGRGTSGPAWHEGAGARLLALTPGEGDWPAELVDESFHVMHNFWPAQMDDDPADELLVASYEGVHVLDRGEDGEWSRNQISSGHQAAEGDQGAGEIKIGKLADGRRYIATVEPWHANHAVVYEETSEGWQRRILTDQLGAGHALWCADFDGDGDEELVVGWRGEGEGDYAQPGVAVFDPGDWSGRIIDSGGMAAEDVTAADLDGDGRPEVIASGRATHNLKIYWNQ